MDIKFPRGYAVVLTPRGEQLVGSILGTSTDLKNIEFDNIIDALITRIQGLITQQKRMESLIGDKAITTACEKYSITSSIELVEKSQTELTRILNNDAGAKARYTTQEKRLNKILDKRKRLLIKWNNAATDLSAAGKLKDPRVAAHVMKEKLKQIENYDKTLTEIEAEYLKAQEDISELGEEIQKISDEMNKLVQSRLKGGTYTLVRQPDGRIMVQSENDVQEIQAYIDRLLEENKSDAKKIRNKKYTTYGDSQGKIRSQAIGKERQARQNLIQALAENVRGLEELEKQDGIEKANQIAKRNVPKITDGVANLLETGQPQIITLEVGGTSGILENLVEGEHAYLGKEALSELQETIKHLGQISVESTGSMNDRVMCVIKAKVDYDIKPFEHDKYTQEILEEEKNFPSEITVHKFGEQKKYDKKDNVFKIVGDTSNYYIEFNDKFRYSYSLQNLPLVGSFDRTTQTMTPNSLLHSVDLFAKADDDLTEKLIFALLNMSSASYLNSQFSNDKVKAIVEQMVSTYLLELAFNIQDFVEGMEREMSKENTLCLFNFADALNVRASQVLEGILINLKNYGQVKDIVSVQVSADTTHQAIPLWMASIKEKPGNSVEQQKARWNWVANEIAANTQLSVKMNVQALLQFFKRK